jgi:hypothetical protein
VKLVYFVKFNLSILTWGFMRSDLCKNDETFAGALARSSVIQSSEEDFSFSKTASQC